MYEKEKNEVLQAALEIKRNHLVALCGGNISVLGQGQPHRRGRLQRGAWAAHGGRRRRAQDIYVRACKPAADNARGGDRSVHRVREVSDRWKRESRLYSAVHAAVGTARRGGKPVRQHEMTIPTSHKPAPLIKGAGFFQFSCCQEDFHSV